MYWCVRIVLFHLILLHMPICSTLMDNTSLQIHMLYTIKWHDMIECTREGEGGGITAPITPPPPFFFIYLEFKFEKFWSRVLLSWHVHCYVWEDSCGARSTKSDNWRPPGPPPSKIAKNIHLVTLWLIYEKVVVNCTCANAHNSSLYWIFSFM